MLSLIYCNKEEKGAILLGVMLFVILMSISMLAAQYFQPTVVRRERESELDFKLKELRKALNQALWEERQKIGEERLVTSLVFGMEKLDFQFKDVPYMSDTDPVNLYDKYSSKTTSEQLAQLKLSEDIKKILKDKVGKTENQISLMSWYNQFVTAFKYTLGEMGYSKDEVDAFPITEGETKIGQKAFEGILDKYDIPHYDDNGVEKCFVFDRESSKEDVEDYLLYVLKDRGYLRTNYQVPLLEGYKVVNEDGTIDEDVKVGWRVAENLLASSSFEEDVLEHPQKMDTFTDFNSVNDYWFSKNGDSEYIQATTVVSPPPYNDYEGQRSVLDRKNEKSGKFGRKVMVLRNPD